MTPLLDAFLELMARWEDSFSQQRTFSRVVRLALAQVLVPGIRTISRVIAACGLDQHDWSADYRVFSRSPWEQSQLFTPVIQEGVSYFSDCDHINLAGDFTHLTKTGRHIPHVHCMRDPMSPAFHVNLIYGLRFVQYTLLLPLYEKADDAEEFASPPRSVPICFAEVPALKKPGRKAEASEWADYKTAVRQRPSSRLALDHLRHIRQEFNIAGVAEKDLLVALDGGFCNKVFFGEVIAGIELVARCRKDAKLRLAAEPGKRGFYSKTRFTPESVRLAPEQPYVEGLFFNGGEWRKIRYKEVIGVFWPQGARRRRLRLIILSPTPYRLSRNGRTHYRKPAHILTTDLKRPVHQIIQCYLDRWQIEVNHREEKSQFGVGDAQVRNTKSVPRQPSFVVAVYAMLLLAAQKAYGSKRGKVYVPLPKWRKGARRPSCLDIVCQLRREMETKPEKLLHFHVHQQVTAYATFRAAA